MVHLRSVGPAFTVLLNRHLMDFPDLFQPSGVGNYQEFDK